MFAENCLAVIWYLSILDAQLVLYYSPLETGASMEDSIEVMLQERNSKLFYRYRDNQVLTFVAGAIFSGIYGLWAMFCLPGLKVPFWLKVPFLPSTKAQTENVMKLLEGRQGWLADLGSGDGRLVSQNNISRKFVIVKPIMH